MSPREQTMYSFIDWLRADASWNAPYGIIDGLSKDKRYRHVTFGKARLLDCEVRVYSPKYITLNTSRTRHKEPTRFTSLSELINHLGDL